jgi:hypothetical protein
MRFASVLAFLTLVPLTQACGDDGGEAPVEPDGPGPGALDGGLDAGLDDAGDPTPPVDAGPPPFDAMPPRLTVCASGGDFETIQEAIDAAGTGSAIEVCEGTYHEHVVLSKAIQLTGIGTVTIDAGDTGIALHVTGVRGGGAIVDNLTLINGRGTETGGGLLVEGSILEALRLEIRNSRAPSGGGAAIYGGNVYLHDSEIRSNQAGLGGGLYLASSARVEDVLIEGNASDGKAGGFFVTGAAPTFTRVTVSNNTAVWDGGGGEMYLSHGTIQDSTFSGNAAMDDAGGLRMHICQATVRNNEFLANQAGGDGGGIKVSHERSEITDNLFEGNASGGAGGGLEVDDDQSRVAHNIFRDNTAQWGGGLHVGQMGSPGTYDDNLFEGNLGVLRGGGVYVSNNFATGVARLRRNVFSDNQAERGGSFGASAAPFELSNSLMTGTTSAVSGSAIYVSMGSVGTIGFVVAVDNPAETSAVRVIDSTLTLHSSILQGNVSVQGTPPVWRYNDLFPLGLFEGMTDPTGLDGNVSVDPVFEDNYRLSAASPLIDAGDPAFEDDDGSPADMGLYGGPAAP